MSHGLQNKIKVMLNECFLRTGFSWRSTSFFSKQRGSTCEELAGVWENTHHSVEVDSEIHVVVMEEGISVLVLAQPAEG